MDQEISIQGILAIELKSGEWARLQSPESGGKALNPNADLGPPLVGS